MQITKLEPVNKRKYRVYLNDEPAFVLYDSEIRDYHLSAGMECSAQLMEELYSAVLSKRAKLRCMNLLKIMDRTESQLRQKLQQEEFPSSMIDDALEYVKSYHYVDDLRYARNFIESRKETKSRRQIDWDLQVKGVKRELIQLAWEETEPVDEAEQIRRLAEKRHFDPETADEKATQRFYQFLQRKGFSYSNIKRALARDS